MKTIALMEPVTVRPRGEADAKNDREFFHIASLSTAAALGTAVAVEESLRAGASGFSFQISAGSFLAFVIGAASALVYWRVAETSQTGARRVSWALGLAGVGLFLYPLRFVPANVLPDIAIGLAVAATVLSTVGYMLWRVTRFLASDERQGELAQDAPSAVTAFNQDGNR